MHLTRRNLLTTTAAALSVGCTPIPVPAKPPRLQAMGSEVNRWGPYPGDCGAYRFANAAEIGLQRMRADIDADLNGTRWP